MIHLLIFVLIEFSRAHMAPGRLPMTELLRLVSAYKGEIHGQDHKDQPAIMFHDVLYRVWVKTY